MQLRKTVTKFSRALLVRIGGDADFRAGANTFGRADAATRCEGASETFMLGYDYAAMAHAKSAPEREWAAKQSAGRAAQDQF